jgi:S1-C subfamily serine protease
VADAVLAIGSPFGLDMTVSRGIISAKRKSLVIEGVTHSNLLQTDAAINQGNSGGPLVARNGAVIGINTAIYTPTGAFAGIGFSVPSNQAKQFVMDELNSLPVSTLEGPSMGLVAFQGPQGGGGIGAQQRVGGVGVGAAGPPIMAGVASPHRDGRQSMVCTNCHDVVGGAGAGGVGRQVQPMMPVAAPAGAVPPPIVAGIASPHVDGREKMTCNTCHTILPSKAGVVALPGPGANGVPYQFAQPPASLAMNVQAGTAANKGGSGQVMSGPGGSVNLLGAYLQAMQPFLAQKLKQPAGRGVFVSGVVPDSPAFAAGLKAGDIILKADGRPIKGPQEISAQLAGMTDGRPVRLGILRDGEPRNLDIASSMMGQVVALPRGNQAAMTGQQIGAPPMTGTPGGQPAKPVVPTEFNWLGVEIENFMQVPAVPGAPKGVVVKGAAVAEIMRGSKAEVNGLKAGDVILEVNNQPVGNAAQMDRSIKASVPNQPVLLKIHRSGQEFFVVL